MANKIRFNDSFGLDLSQVIGWKRVPPKLVQPQNPEFVVVPLGAIPMDNFNLEVYTHGNTITFRKDEPGFDYILKILCEECEFEPPKDTF